VGQCQTRNAGVGQLRKCTVCCNGSRPAFIYARSVLPQVPHAGVWAESIPRDNVETACRAAHSVPFGDPIRKSKDVPGALLESEALRLDVGALDGPHLEVRFLH
jgi:hypothetical protein